jgi:hypothetical protein
MKLVHQKGELAIVHTAVKVIFLFWNCRSKLNLYINVSISYSIKMYSYTKIQITSPCKPNKLIVNIVKILQLIFFPVVF